MQLGSFARWLKRETRNREAELFAATVDGQGKDLVLIHGLAASPETWEGVRPSSKISTGIEARAHYIHMRGFAGSPATPFRTPGQFLKPMADSIAYHIRAQGNGPAAIAGHSMGGLVALILARDHPDVVDRVLVADVPAFFSVLINPFATANSISHFAEMSRRRYIERSKSGLEDDLRRATERLVTSPGDVERIVRWGLASDTPTVADVMSEVMTTDLRGDLAHIEAPVDVIYAWDRAGHNSKGGIDQIYAASYAGLVQGRRTRIDDARHYVMFDQPEIFYTAMREWLTRR
jgi:pimeloyl-ACP methyl ester carboxylesterase